MPRSPRQKAAVVAEAIQEIPGALDMIEGVAIALIRGKRQYVDRHWGAQGRRGAWVGNVPDVSAGVVEFGRLVLVQYEAAKGPRARVELFEHAFKKPFPVLGETVADGGLVIVRDQSRYTVTTRGIEG